MSASEAQALAYALEFGAADTDEVREWAFAQIAAAENPGDDLLELVTGHHVADAVTRLHRLGQDACGAEVGRLVYRVMLKAVRHGSLGYECAAAAIVRLARESSSPSPEAESESWDFDDAFDLARQQIYGSIESVCAELEAHLQRFAV